MQLTKASSNTVGFLDPSLPCYETRMMELPRDCSCQACLLITLAEIPLEHQELESEEVLLEGNAKVVKTPPPCLIHSISSACNLLSGLYFREIG